MSDEQEGARRLAKVLQQYLLAAGLSLDEIDRRLGWRENSLAEALNGSVELKVKDLIAVLRAAGIEEKVFFSEIYDLEPRFRSTSGQTEIPYSTGHLSEEGADFPATEEVLSLFRSLVEEAVQEGKDHAVHHLDDSDLVES